MRAPSLNRLRTSGESILSIVMCDNQRLENQRALATFYSDFCTELQLTPVEILLFNVFFLFIDQGYHGHRDLSPQMKVIRNFCQ